MTEDGTLIFGDVHLHRDLIPKGDATCYGGGFWTIDNQRGVIILYGRSFDFGAPEFNRMQRIKKDVMPVILGYPIFYKREFCGEDILEPIQCQLPK